MVSSSSSKYHTKIVTSSICGVGDLDDIAEKIIVVENLSERTEEVKLLQKKSPRTLSAEEMNELVDEDCDANI